MIQNYLKLAFRNLFRHRLFSALNIFGLALSMSVCLFILLLLRDAYQYDDFHPQGERIYRVLTEAVRKSGDTEPYATTPFPLGAALRDGYSKIEESVRLVRRLNGEARAGGKILPVSGLYAEPTFFSVFGFSLQEGNAATALDEPFSIILSEETANRFFPRESALGKSLEMNGFGTFKVTGVLAPPPGKTHLEFDALGSISTLLALEKNNGLERISTDWNNYYGTYTFVKLQPGAAAADAEGALKAIADTEYRDKTLESRDQGYRFNMQPLSAITPGPMLSNGMGRGLPAVFLWFLSALGIAVMLSACFNYTNLTLARALMRAREIGVRKVMGASRRQVAGQLLGEGVATALVSLCVGWLLLKLVQPAFNSLSFAESADVNVREDGYSTLLFLGFAVCVGLIAGALPALAMSKISPASVLRKLEGVRLFRRVGLRKVLLVAQFTVSMVFIIMVTVLSRQIGHVMGMEYGFRSKQIYNVELQGESPERIKAALAAVPGVESITAASHNMGTWADYADDVRVSPDAEPESVREYFVDRNYRSTMDLTLVAGSDFPADAAPGKESFVLVNETFLRHFQLGTAAEAPGKQIVAGDSTRLIIRGVLKDFLFKPAAYALEPMMLRNNPDNWNMLHIRLSGGDPVVAVTAIRREWSKAVPERELAGAFYDATLRDNYAEMKDMLSIISVFAFLGIFIAGLGLLGMATYTVETRTREVSVRKVLGASVPDLMLLLSRNFLVLLLVAFVLAAPLGWFLGDQFLGTFAYRISMGPGQLLPGALLLFLTALLTIGAQTFRAARANPVNALRSE